MSHHEVGEYVVRAGPAAIGSGLVAGGVTLNEVLTAILILYTLAQFADFVWVRVKRYRAEKRNRADGG